MPNERRIKTLCALAAWLCTAAVAADDGGTTAKTDQAREDMQRALNQQVMAAPFNPGDVKKAQGYAEQAKKEGVLPVPQAPGYWQPGWTCGSLDCLPVLQLRRLPQLHLLQPLLRPLLALGVEARFRNLTTEEFHDSNSFAYRP